VSTDLFQNINKFVSIEESELEKIILYFSRENVKKKGLLMCIGDKVLHEYFVLEGCLQMYFTDGEGIEHTVQFALKGWWLADYLSLQKKKPAGFCIRAVENSELLSISRKAFPCQLLAEEAIRLGCMCLFFCAFYFFFSLYQP